MFTNFTKKAVFAGFIGALIGATGLYVMRTHSKNIKKISNTAKASEAPKKQDTRLPVHQEEPTSMQNEKTCNEQQQSKKTHDCRSPKQHEKKQTLRGSIALAFTSIAHESSGPQTLLVEGSIPTWLIGSLLRTGPALFEHQKEKAFTLFDGCAMLHRFTFDQGTITYHNHFIRSDYWKQVHTKGKFGMQTQSEGSLFSKLGSLLLKDSAPTYDNGGGDICCIDGTFCAITESPLYNVFNPKDFSESGHLKFDDDLSAHYSCAHMHQDKKTGDLYSYLIQFGNTSTYIPYKISAHSKKRIPLAKINVSYPAYMHSFAYTENYLILVEPPLRVNPLHLALGDKSFLETYIWDPKQKTNIIVIDKKTGKTKGTYQTSPFFYLHHINAYEQYGSIIIDLPVYTDNKIASGFNLQPYRDGKQPDLPKAIPTRLIIDQKTKQVITKKLSDLSIETPNINYGLVNGQPYNFVYGTHIPENQSVMTHLIKLDVSSGKSVLWHEEHCYPGEPVFVPNPSGKAEDAGVLLSLVLDISTGTSFLLVLDSKTMDELGRAHLPHHVPIDSHGHFYKTI